MQCPKLKPIFHQNAKYLASGVGVGQCPRRQNFVLEMPTCCYILALPNAKICVFPDANPQRQSVEYRLCWVPTQNTGVGHVHFMFFVYISFAFGAQREPHFKWNMGFRVHPSPGVHSSTAGCTIFGGVYPVCARFLSHLLLLYIGRVHGAISGCTVLWEVHPASVQNKCLISDTRHG